MTEIRQPHYAQDCPPPPKDPAGQPHPPCVEPCADLPKTTPPTLDPPAECPPDPTCRCPQPRPPHPNCLENLSAKLAAELAKADKLKTFKADVDALLTKAQAAKQDYTHAAYEKLVKQWVDEDAAIVELIRKLVCALPCWRCIIECYVCPLLDDLHNAEQWLYGDGTQYDKVHNLYDLEYWRDRDRDVKQRRWDQIKAVLAVWEKPAQTIAKNLTDDQALIDAINKSMITDPGRAVYDVFLKLVPMHLATAPPKGSPWTTKIGKEYTEFCKCDVGEPDACCGPDVGKLSLRALLIGPQPYLIPPHEYIRMICCLVEKRYEPAKQALSQAEADWSAIDTQIKTLRDKITNGLKSLEKDAKGAIPTAINCCDYDVEGDRPDTRR
jgi:hypothetical protein